MFLIQEHSQDRLIPPDEGRGGGQLSRNAQANDRVEGLQGFSFAGRRDGLAQPPQSQPEPEDSPETLVEEQAMLDLFGLSSAYLVLMNNTFLIRLACLGDPPQAFQRLGQPVPATRTVCVRADVIRVIADDLLPKGNGADADRDGVSREDVPDQEKRVRRS